MPVSSEGFPQSRLRGSDVRASARLIVALIVGAAGGLVTSLLTTWHYAILAGWMLGALTFLAGTWAAIWPMNATITARHATREDAVRTLTDLLVVLSSVASLAAVALLLVGS